MSQSLREDVSHQVLVQFCPVVVAILDFQPTQKKIKYVKDHLMIIKYRLGSISFVASDCMLFICCPIWTMLNLLLRWPLSRIKTCLKYQSERISDPISHVEFQNAMNEWWLFNAKWAIFRLFWRENKFHFDEMRWWLCQLCVRSTSLVAFL